MLLFFSQKQFCKAYLLLDLPLDLDELPLLLLLPDELEPLDLRLNQEPPEDFEDEDEDEDEDEPTPEPELRLPLLPLPQEELRLTLFDILSLKLLFWAALW